MKILLTKPMHLWEDNIKMDVQEIGCEGDWIKFLMTGSTDAVF